MPFDPARQLQIEAFIGAERVSSLGDNSVRVRLVTKGLQAVNRLELELLGVPGDLAHAGAVVLNNVAGYVANERAICDAQTFGLGLGPCLLVGRAYETVSHGQRVLRLQDIADAAAGERPAGMLLSTAQLARGTAVAEENEEEAVARWRACVEYFPGDPAEAGYHFKPGQIVNQENHLTYLFLARHDAERASEWYRRGLERSSLTLAYELGTMELNGAEPDRVAREAKALVELLLAGDEPWGAERMVAGDAKGSELMAMVPAPMVVRRAEGLMRPVSVAPFPFRGYFYEAPVRARLQSSVVHALVAELYAAACAAPAKVLALTRDTRDLWLMPLDPLEAHGVEPEAGPPAMPLPLPVDGVVCLPLVSRLLAELGRLFAAGLTLDEVRARFELKTDALAKASAQAKVAAQADLEQGWFVAAMSM
ncbi:MAG: hypothetical protein JNK82_24310 [Myxococcaceae bacterium]|nr:hypothetical protein [Myxococcaceae bacterium]